jgi:hypothetical protein
MLKKNIWHFNISGLLYTYVSIKYKANHSAIDTQLLINYFKDNKTKPVLYYYLMTNSYKRNSNE